MFDFDKKTDRTNTNSLKWMREDELPLWVADMDFETAPCIQKAIAKRAAHGIFGYSIIPNEWTKAYIKWWDERHDFRMEASWIMFATGVIPAVSTAVRRFTHPAENVLMLTPIYNTFYNSIVNNGRNPLEIRMKYQDGKYTIDFDALEAGLKNPQTTMMILCNPHNPAGILWDEQTLAKIGKLCYDNNVLVFADEIHCDLTDPGKHYTPFASINEICKNNCIMAIAPTKAFNIAGIQTAAVCVPNPLLRQRMYRGLNNDEVGEPNAFAVDAVVAAFTEGEQWLNELNKYIYENKLFVDEYLKTNIPSVKMVPSEATYLVWLDCLALPGDKKNLSSYIRNNAKVYLSAGKSYGLGGDDFLRLNLATQREVLEEGLSRLKEGVESWEKEYGSKKGIGRFTKR